MSWHTPIPMAVQELFDRECNQVAQEPQSTGGTRPTLDFSPAFWVLSELFEAVTTSQSPRKERLKGLVRRRLVECLFMDQGGDRVIDPHYQPQLERQVDLVVAVLEQLRQHTVGRRWSPEAVVASAGAIADDA